MPPPTLRSDATSILRRRRAFLPVEALEPRRLLSTSLPVDAHPGIAAPEADGADDNVQQTGNHADDTEIREQGDDQEGDPNDDDTGEHADVSWTFGKTFEGMPTERTPAAEPPLPRKFPAGTESVSGSSEAGSGGSTIARSGGPMGVQVDGRAGGPDRSNAGRSESPDAPLPHEQDTSESDDNLAADPAQVPALQVTSNPRIAVTPPAENLAVLLESGAEAISRAQANASPFDESVVQAAFAPVIVSSASSQTRAGWFSAIAIKDAAMEAKAGSTPAASDGAERLVKVVVGGAVVSGAPVQYAYHFARVNAAATFSDALGKFIDDCASLAPAIVAADRNPAHHRAWRITFAVIAADVALGAYVLHRAWDRRRRASVERFLWRDDPGI